MIQLQTILNAADNSGARTLMCIKVLGGTRRRYATVGDVIKVSVKDAIPRGIHHKDGGEELGRRRVAGRLTDRVYRTRCRRRSRC